jgi:hypothetical protein
MTEENTPVLPLPDSPKRLRVVPFAMVLPKIRSNSPP